jgi:hypothetical protein
MLAITHPMKEKRIKVAKWGTPKKYLKKKPDNNNPREMCKRIQFIKFNCKLSFYYFSYI